MLDPTTVATQRVANRLHELCAKGQYHEAMQELYADSARHVEVMEMPGSPTRRVTERKRELLAKSEQFGKSTEIHDASVSKPMANGDQFVCDMMLDCTAREGPMAGRRMKMQETCLYTVRDGKITEAKFFHGCG